MYVNYIMKPKYSKSGKAALGMAQGASSHGVKHQLMKLIKQHVDTRKRLKHEMHHPSKHHATQLHDLQKAHNKASDALRTFVQMHPEERKHSITVLHAAQKKAGVYGSLK